MAASIIFSPAPDKSPFKFSINRLLPRGPSSPVNSSFKFSQIPSLKSRSLSPFCKMISSLPKVSR